MASTATVAARPARNYEAIAFHAVMVCFVILTQVLYTSARNLGPDNTWHYRLARAIVSGEPVFWAGLDGNRLFPDLLFAIGAYELSGGALFATWLYVFYALFFLACYGSLAALAATLYDETRERRAFVFLSVAGLWLFEIAAPFWGRWFFDPGNHGTGLPVALACLALILFMNRRMRLSMPAALVFIAAASLLIGSNRFLFVGFLVPLVMALAAALLVRWLATRAGPSGAVRAPAWSAPLPALIGLVALAMLGGYGCYKALSAMSWHRSVTYMETSLAQHASLFWAWDKFRSELADFGDVFVRQTRQVAVGPILMLLAVPASLTLLAQTRHGASRTEENRAAYAVFTACSALLSIAFVIWAWDEHSEWRYRYFAMATAFAVVLVAMLLTGFCLALGRAGVLSMGVLAGLLVLTEVLAVTGERTALVAQNQEFQRDVAALQRIVAERTGQPNARGLAEYWIATDISARTSTRVDPLEADKPQLRFYSSNAGGLCTGNYRFILRPIERNEPKREAITAVLGEPTSEDVVPIQGHGRVEVMFYDPDVLRARITEPGRKAAEALFPGFRCSR